LEFPVSDDIYDETHAALNRLVGRHHNNPLGDAAFPLLRRLARGTGMLQVLDVGSGRGASSRWWAARGARVTALEPSPAMRAESGARALAEGVATAIDHAAGGLEALDPDRRFDVALALDVLCYLPDPTAALRTIVGSLAPDGLLCVTDYHGRAQRAEVAAVTAAWGIRPPPTFDDFHATLERLPVNVLLHVDTTRQYRAHWRAVAAALERRRMDAVAIAGTDAVARFANQVRSIEAAIATGEFGHSWAILEVHP
jgi:SAM-dependent methyltransferase